MNPKSKILRYYYWLFREFTKKHAKLILFSFFLSFLIIVTLISFTPYLTSILIPKKEIIGLTGQYDLETLPNEITSKISHGLVSVNEKGQIIPALATSWEANADHTKFRFQLKKNLFWDDGGILKAKDINYHFKDVKIKAVGDSTLDFILKKPLAIFPIYLSAPVLRKPLHGLVGEYKVEGIRRKYGVITELRLDPNRNDLPVIIYRFYDNENKLINAYKKGEITQMSITKQSQADAFRSWKNSEIIKNVNYTKVLSLFFNLKNNQLKEKEVRQAIAASIPKDRFISLGELADSPIPPVSWAYNQNLKKIIFNPDLAKKTLNKYESSESAKLQFKTYYDYLSMATEINDSLQKSGLKTELNLISFDPDPQFDILLTFWEINFDPDQYYFWHSMQTQSNITGYKNVKIDKLLEDGRGALASKDRKNYYHEFQKVLVDETPAVFIYYPYAYIIKRK